MTTIPRFGDAHISKLLPEAIVQEKVSGRKVKLAKPPEELLPPRDGHKALYTAEGTILNKSGNNRPAILLFPVDKEGKTDALDIVG